MWAQVVAEGHAVHGFADPMVEAFLNAIGDVWHIEGDTQIDQMVIEGNLTGGNKV